MFGFGWRLIVCVWFLTLFCEQTSSLCTQLTPCSCMFSDGQGYDLSSLSKSRPLQVTSNNYSIYFHPCTNIPLSSIQSSECVKGNGVSLCVEYDNSSFSLGSAEETSIEIGSAKSKTPSLILHHKNYTSSVALSCCDICDTQLFVDRIVWNKEYHLVLVSPHACKLTMHTNGLSIGSVLLICFLLFTGIYFIGGAIVLKLLRGATGWEMIPNHEFWRNLPTLIKDRMAFIFNCRRMDSYHRI